MRLESRQRRAQLVGQVRHQLVAVSRSALQARGHVLEGVEQLRHLRCEARLVDELQCTALHPSSSLSEAFERLGHSPGQEPGRDHRSTDRHDEGEEDADGQRRRQRLHRVALHGGIALASFVQVLGEQSRREQARSHDERGDAQSDDKHLHRHEPSRQARPLLHPEPIV